MIKIEFIKKWGKIFTSDTVENMSKDLDSVIQAEAEQRYEKACVFLRECRRKFPSDEEYEALRIAAGEDDIGFQPPSYGKGERMKPK